MGHFQGRLFLFGGIHEVTHELDDLYGIDLTKLKWVELDKDSLNKGKSKNFKKSIQPQQEAKTPVDSNQAYSSGNNNQAMGFSNYSASN